MPFRKRLFPASLLLLITSPAWAATITTVTATQFLNGFGVDTHFPYTDGAYANVPADIVELQYLNVKRVRDGLTNGARGSAPLSTYVTVAREAGVKFTLGLGYLKSSAGLQAALALVDQFERAVPGAVEAIEGPNEINNWPVTFNGVTGFAGALAEQQAIYTAVKADPLLKGVPVVFMTGYPTVLQDPVASGYADYDNGHPYPYPTHPPGPWLARSRSLTNTANPAEPTRFTETGYHSVPSQSLQAWYTLDLLMDCQEEGIAEVDLYELKDGYPPGARQGDDNYGLWGAIKGPNGATVTVIKPVAVDIHNLTTLLADAPAAGATYVPVTPVITGLPARGGTLVIEKSNHTDYIAVWAEPTVLDDATKKEIPIMPVQVTVSFPAAHWSVFDPTIGATALQSGDSGSVVLSLAAHPILVAVSAH